MLFVVIYMVAVMGLGEDYGVTDIGFCLDGKVFS